MLLFKNDFIEDRHNRLKKALKNLKEDMSVEAFLTTHLPDKKYDDIKNSVRKFVEGYDAAEIARRDRPSRTTP